MNPDNKIISHTRQTIADEMIVSKLYYHGDKQEPDFLNRIYDLSKMHSNDRRYSDAYGDIYQHMVNNTDWDEDWVFTDTRFNLLHCPDEEFLRFLSETVHPRVRSNTDVINKLLDIYNKHLYDSGYQISATSETGGRPIYTGTSLSNRAEDTLARKTEIKKYLDTTYVDSKIDLMNKSINTDTDLAIGTAKELLETTCKSILNQKGVTIDSDWTLAKLNKETTGVLDLKPTIAPDPGKAEKSIRQILQGISTAVQGITELRNAYGSGHGKAADFKGLESRYARFITHLVADIVIFYLASNTSQVELVEDNVTTNEYQSTAPIETLQSSLGFNIDEDELPF